MRLHLPAPTRKELGANKHLAGAFLALSAVGPFFCVYKSIRRVWCRKSSELYLSCWTDDQSGSPTGQQSVLIKAKAFCTRSPLPRIKIPKEHPYKENLVYSYFGSQWEKVGCYSGERGRIFIILSSRPSIQISRSDNTIWGKSSRTEQRAQTVFLRKCGGA